MFLVVLHDLALEVVVLAGDELVGGEVGVVGVVLANIVPTLCYNKDDINLKTKKQVFNCILFLLFLFANNKLYTLCFKKDDIYDSSPAPNIVSTLR